MPNLKHFFLRFSIKAWKGIDFDGNKHTTYNAIVNQNYINYYCKYWKDKNEKLHDEDVQRKRVIEWQQKEYARALEGQHPQVRKFAIEKIEVEKCTTEKIRRWMCVEID